MTSTYSHRRVLGSSKRMLRSLGSQVSRVRRDVRVSRVSAARTVQIGLLGSRHRLRRRETSALRPRGRALTSRRRSR